ncbi:ABC transporter ATP-binding protein [Clostridium sp. DL1XJH146]
MQFLPQLTIILAIVVPAITVCIVIVIKKGYPLFMKVQSSLDKVNKVMQENLSGIRVVKAFVRKDFEEERFRKANDNLMDITVKATKTVSLITPVMMLLLNLGMIAVVWFGGIEVKDGNLQVGEVMAFINYLLQLLMALMMVATIFMRVSRAEASASRILEVLNTNEDIVDAKDSHEIKETNGQLEFHNVYFSYGENEKDEVLKNVSFTASRGEKVAILGATGSGKTTLISLILRLYDIDEGKITLDGKDIRKIKIKSLRKSIGIAMQQTILFSGSIADNIRYGIPQASYEEVQEVAKIVQADDFISKIENGYETTLGQRGVNLSGGQKQRIAIARALITKPAILILDDSTSAVDVKTEVLIQNALKEKFKNTTVLMVAQRISSVLDADKILVLAEGKIVAQGKHDELIKSNEVYKDIYKSQLGEVGEYFG